LQRLKTMTVEGFEEAKCICKIRSKRVQNSGH